MPRFPARPLQDACSRADPADVSTLVSAIDSTFPTDFAILHVAQRGVWADFTDPAFAHAAPGYLGMMAGAKYANLTVRVEVWDGEPPRADGTWQESDILPWRSVPDGGPVQASGFDPPDGGGLDVSGIRWGLAEVSATGRKRYEYSSLDTDDLPPERWAVRIWPVPGPVDALDLPPPATSTEG